jgi:hypothetical protein
MNQHEARLHAMIAQHHWGPLNEEDRAAIQWLIDRTIWLQDELHARQLSLTKEIRKTIEMRDAAQKASEEFMKVAVRY